MYVIQIWIKYIILEASDIIRKIVNTQLALLLDYMTNVNATILNEI